jgi:hypothetical protein
MDRSLRARVLDAASDSHDVSFSGAAYLLELIRRQLTNGQPNERQVPLELELQTGSLHGVLLSVTDQHPSIYIFYAYVFSLHLTHP